MELVILCGLPASGKSTYYREQLAATHIHVSKDLWPNAANKEKRQVRELRAALAAGHKVVVDNTNPTVAQRARLIDLAKEYGARVLVYYFRSTVDLSLVRNAGRSGRAKVPDVAVYTIAKRLEPPTPAEGMDELIIIEQTANKSALY